MTPEHSHDCDCPTPGFGGLGIAPKLLEILDQLKLVTPTPIQHQSIPVAMKGHDVIGIAQTGTGKTLSFGIPTLQRLAQFKGAALIVLPTRELALQVDESLHRVGDSLGLKTAVLIGGASMGPQRSALAAKPHVIVCTPGRIIDHIEHKTVDLSNVRILVLDEADRMLDMGFLPQIRKILRNVPKERQTMLFSATMPEDIVRIARDYMKTPVRVEVAPPGTTAERVEHELFVVKKDQKNRLLESLLQKYEGTVLVFTRTKHMARRVAKRVKDMGHTSADIHSDRTLAQRRDALEGFKTGKYRVLVATDIAARGIDVTGIEVVINYDIPANPDDYVHRIGRTGRAGSKGRAVTFAMVDEGDYIEQIEKLARVRLPVSKLPELPPDRVSSETRSGGRGRDLGRRGGRSQRDSRPGERRSSSGRAGAKPQKKTDGRRDDRPAQRKPADRKPQKGGGGGGGRRNGSSGGVDLGIALWPDTPNIHGGLNRKSIK
jgi:ATP-dependent RNA helicase RhlE